MSDLFVRLTHVTSRVPGKLSLWNQGGVAAVMPQGGVPLRNIATFGERPNIDASPQGEGLLFGTLILQASNLPGLKGIVTA